MGSSLFRAGRGHVGRRGCRLDDEKGSAMSTPVVTVEGIVKPDGTVEIPEKVDLPAGKVQVTLVPLPELPPDDPFWQRTEQIWAGQRARGHVPRTREEIDAEIESMRDEMEDEFRDTEHLQEECRRAREQARPRRENPA
jgi:hypothetical protein